MTPCFTEIAVIGLFNPSMLILKFLAVVGGFTVGAVATGWLAKGLAKMMAFQKVSPFLLRGSRLLGGLAVGFVVWAGLGGGGDGWWPFGQGGGAGTSGSGGTSAPKDSADQVPTITEQTVRVLMRGGAQAENDQRFYILEAEPPRTWQDLEPILAERNKNSNLKVIEIVIGKDSVDEENPAVKKLKAWATKNGVKVQIENPI
jgi:hypothetical protein